MTRLFRAIRDAILLPIGERDPMTCRDAGRKGAAIRHAKERERYRAKARWLRAQCGMDPDPRLGAM